MTEVIVNLPSGRYSILIAPAMIKQLGQLVSRLELRPQALVVTDANVGPLYGEQVLAGLRGAGIKTELATVPAGEQSKSLAAAMELYTKAITLGLDRRSPIIALGGGVVGDLTGFVAATYLRGVPFIQIPTSLLAQVDSSVGGKVAVNHPLGKNLIGAFYQPRLVVIDTDLLATLPKRELSSGLSEIIKAALIADQDFYRYLSANHAVIMAGDSAALIEITNRSCQIKARVVEEDEKETRRRMVLNFGHTIGHAVEAAAGYGVYTHGEAVAIGMHGATLLSHYMGLCPAPTVDAVCLILKQFGLPSTAKGCRPDELFNFLLRDKKNLGNRLNWVLLGGIGQVTISDNAPELLIRRVLAEIT